MRFAGVQAEILSRNGFVDIENTGINYSLADKNLDKKKHLSDSDNKKEKKPLTLKTAHSSDALLQGFVTTELFQNIILTPSIEFSCTSFSSQTINSVSYYFSSSSFFKTLFRCFISPNAP
jgi:hypothetical protein